jgi:hypothetical protein
VDDEVPSRSSEPLHAQTSSVGLCVVVSQDALSLSWTSVTQYTTKLLERLKVTSSIDGFLLWQKLHQYASFTAFHNAVHLVLRLTKLFAKAPELMQTSAQVR